jgi:hypothetical protein
MEAVNAGHGREKREFARMSTTWKIMAVAATALGAAGMLTIPVPAAAEPGCLDWRLGKSGDEALFLDLDNGVRIGVPWLGGTNKVRINPSNASLLESPDGGRWQGEIEPGGGTYQGDTIRFRINWTQGVGAEHPMSAFTGKIDANGVASGTVVNEKNVTNGWTAHPNFFCSARAAEPAPAQQPKPAEPGPQNPPADQNASTITADVELYDVPGGEGTYLGDVAGGRKVKVLTRQADNWVQISGTGVANHDTGWVWGDFVGP